MKRCSGVLRRARQNPGTPDSSRSGGVAGSRESRRGVGPTHPQPPPAPSQPPPSLVSSVGVVVEEELDEHEQPMSASKKMTARGAEEPPPDSRRRSSYGARKLEPAAHPCSSTTAAARPPHPVPLAPPPNHPPAADRGLNMELSSRQIELPAVQRRSGRRLILLRPILPLRRLLMLPGGGQWCWSAVRGRRCKPVAEEE
jgi:hypothetical protein